ncbi:MAG TPA: hypothetical protein VIJ33_05940 [Solirubrobacteraceae bacterium]
MLVAKIVLAPAFVVGASLTVRRYGARVGGLVGGLPVVAGPILLVYALDHGRVFAAEAAAGTLLGLVSLLAFIAVYSHLASRMPWGASLIFGWGAFFAMTGALSAVTLDADQTLGVVLVVIVFTLLVLPRARGEQRSGARFPRWDLPLRALSALALVLVLTTVAGQLGAKLSGLLAPFPVIASVLAVFTHAQHGEQDVLRIMRGFVMGLVAYALFCFVLSVSLESLDIAEAFVFAAAAALATQAVALTVTWRRREPAAEPL